MFKSADNNYIYSS